MRKKLWQYLNPMAHLGEKSYSLKFPLFTTLSIYILLELIGNLVWKHPNDMGNLIIFTNFALVLYFAFRDAIKGGLTVTILSVLYYIYFLITRQAPLDAKLMGAFIATLISITNLVITLIIGWHRQTVDNLLAREIEAKLSAEHEKKRLQILLEQLPVGVIIAQSSNGEVLSTNHRAQKIFGRSSRLSLSLNDFAKLTAHSNGQKIGPEEWPLAKALLEGKTIVGQEINLTNKRGKQSTLFVNAAPITDKNGNIITAVTTIYDITKQKELEQQKDDFIAMASHELRTPLTSTQMYAQLLLREFSDNPKAANLVTKMNNQVNKLTKLVVTMLDTRRIEQGKLILEESPFILRDVALESVESLKNTTSHKLVVEWKAKHYVFGNREKIAQVFINLLTNAMKYSPNKSKIVITSQKKDKAIIVGVQDFGTGISREEQKHIFERFYQASHHKTYAGLGLGLYISAEIIKQHGGKIWVASEKGKGATFYFSLPIYTKNKTA